MHLILFGSPIEQSEYEKLSNTFPQFVFLAPTPEIIEKFSEEDWEQVEIFYGTHLSKTQLNLASRLRWIHSPSPDLSSIPLNEIIKRENILVSNEQELGIHQIGEYVIGAALFFAKQFSYWQAPKEEKADQPWLLEGCTFVQVGLGQLGSEIARKAKLFGLKVFGVSTKRSFHPACDKVFAYSELHSLLPAADILSIAVPRREQEALLIQKKELDLMEDDTLCLITQSERVVNISDLESLVKKGKFRGVMIDSEKLVKSMQKLDRCLITQNVAHLPKLAQTHPLALFNYNFRQYLYGNFSNMKNILHMK